MVGEALEPCVADTELLLAARVKLGDTSGATIAHCWFAPLLNDQASTVPPFAVELL